MNFVHAHLVINHFPLVLAVAGAAMLAWGLFRREGQTQRAALALIVASAASAALAFWTGDEGAELALRLPGWAPDLIRRHERAAEVSLWAVAAMGGAAAWSLWEARRLAAPRPNTVRAVALLSLACLALLAWTSYLGGQIRHSEIQPDSKEWRL